MKKQNLIFFLRSKLKLANPKNLPGSVPKCISGSCGHICRLESVNQYTRPNSRRSIISALLLPIMFYMGREQRWARRSLLTVEFWGVIPTCQSALCQRGRGIAKRNRDRFAFWFAISPADRSVVFFLTNSQEEFACLFHICKIIATKKRLKIDLIKTTVE